MLREESEIGGNGWYEVRERLGQTAGYLTDILKAWELAESSWTEATLFKVLGLQCRYALIRASLNSLAASLPDNLLIALVKKRIWIPEQGLAYALQIPDQQKKANSLINLAEHLASPLQKQALLEAQAAARSITNNRSRAQALSAIANKLPNMLPEALTVAGSIPDESYRAQALSAIADKLPKDLMPIPV